MVVNEPTYILKSAIALVYSNLSDFNFGNQIFLLILI